ncbi:hypothetical protein RCL1_002562 [Eukaryota sp. TZLM3-RCL]
MSSLDSFKTTPTPGTTPAFLETAPINIFEVVSSMFLYLIFLVIFVIAFHLQRPNTEAFYFADGLKEVIVRNNFDPSFEHHEKTFSGIATLDDIWNYIRGCLLDQILVGKWYNGQDLPSSDQYKYVHRYNRILGGISLRTMRVRNDSCTVPVVFSELIDDCYADLFPETEEKSPYGPVIEEGKHAWNWNSSTELKGYSYLGLHNSYEGSGYTVDLPLNRSNADEIIEYLYENIYIDKATRAVFIDFTVYNSALNLFCIVRLLVELPAGGGIFPVYTFRTIKLFNYLRREDFKRLIFEILLIFGNFIYTLSSIRKLFKQGISKYFSSKWHINDWIIHFCLFGLAYMRFQSFITINETLQDNSRYSATTGHVYQTVGFVMNQELNVLSVLAFFMFFSLFKYLDISHRLSLLTRVIRTASKDIFAFVIIFGIVFLGYAFAGRLAFGIDVFEYRSMKHSCLSLFRMVVGDFDYERLFRANRIIGPTFIISFMFLVYFILLNMFLAIINDTFSVIREEESRQKEDVLFSTLSNLSENFKQKLKRKFSSKQLVNPMQSYVAASQQRSNPVVDINSLTHFLNSKSEATTIVFGNLTPQQILTRFDSDKDGYLSRNEFEKIVNQVESAGKQIEEKQLYSMFMQQQFEKFKAGVNTDDVLIALNQRINRLDSTINSISSQLEEIAANLRRSRYSR